MIQRPSQEEIEKGLAEFKGDYKRILRNITNCLEFDYKAICSLRTLLADSKEQIQLYFRMPCHLLHPIQENI